LHNKVKYVLLQLVEISPHTTYNKIYHRDNHMQEM